MTTWQLPHHAAGWVTDGGSGPTSSSTTGSPSVRIIGGCCGTDVRQVAAMWDRWTPVGAGPHRSAPK